MIAVTAKIINKGKEIKILVEDPPKRQFFVILKADKLEEIANCEFCQGTA